MVTHPFRKCPDEFDYLRPLASTSHLALTLYGSVVIWPYPPPAWPRGHGPVGFANYSALVCECGWQSPILPCVDRAEKQRQAWIAHAAEHHSGKPI